METFHDPPNWRWLRAVELVDAQARPSRVHDDENVVRAFKFLKKKRVANVTKLRGLRAEYPDIFAANKIYEEEDEDRWMLEAALCTEGVHEQICKDYGYPTTREVQAYADLFWDVRTHLGSPVYIRKYVIRPALRNRTMVESSPDFIAKVIGLSLGYDTLLASWKFDFDSPECHKLTRLALSNKKAYLGIEASQTQAVNRYTSLELIEKASDVHREAIAEGPGTRDAAVQAVHELIQSVTFRKRTPADRKTLGSDGLEPRALENQGPELEKPKQSS